MMLPGALTVLLLSLASSTVPDMNDNASRALALDIRRLGDAIEVQLIGQSPQSLQVTYTLDVGGKSTSRHSGKTTIAANHRTVLSTIRVSAGEDWCVRLVAEEDGGEPYEISQGNCPG